MERYVVDSFAICSHALQSTPGRARVDVQTAPAPNFWASSVCDCGGTRAPGIPCLVVVGFALRRHPMTPERRGPTRRWMIWKPSQPARRGEGLRTLLPGLTLVRIRRCTPAGARGPRRSSVVAVSEESGSPDSSWLGRPTVVASAARQRFCRGRLRWARCRLVPAQRNVGGREDRNTSQGWVRGTSVARHGL